MANQLSIMKEQIINKNKSEVQTLLGAPLKIGYWTNSRLAEGADAATIADFEATQLDEIWIYSNGRVHFNLAGKALSVDDNVSRDLPPEENPPLIA